MATQLQQKKLKALYEQSRPEGPGAFRSRFEQSCGVRYREAPVIGIDGEWVGTRQVAYYDPEYDQFRDSHRQRHEQDASGNWQIGETMASVVGPNWRQSLDQFWDRSARARFEANGDWSSGDTPYVSAGLDVVAGLMNARSLARAADPEWIWDRFCTVQEASGEGGFHIGHRTRPDNLPFTDLAEGQPPSVTKGTQIRVHRNRTLRQALRTEVSLWTLRDDLTGQAMESVDQQSVFVLAERERKVADAVLGVSSGTTLGTGVTIGIQGNAMPVIQDGLTWFPYQKGIYGTNANSTTIAPENGLQIANYANCNDTDGYGLQDYTAIVRAMQMLTANRDPFTKLPTQVSIKGMMFFAPTEAAAVQLKFLLQAEALWQIANFGFNPGIGAAGTVGRAQASKFNLVEEMGLSIHTSQYWANRCIDVGLYKVSSAGAKTQQALTNSVGDSYNTVGSIMSAFWMGHFKEALVYWQRMPYTTQQCPLGPAELGRQIVLVQDHHERGQTFWAGADGARKVYRTWA